MRQVRGDVQGDQCISEPGEVLEGVFQVPGGGDLGCEGEQGDRDGHPYGEHGGEDDGVVGDASSPVDPPERVGPPRQHGHVLDDDDPHDRHRQE